MPHNHGDDAPFLGSPLELAAAFLKRGMEIQQAFLGKNQDDGGDALSLNDGTQIMTAALDGLMATMKNPRGALIKTHDYRVDSARLWQDWISVCTGTKKNLNIDWTANSGDNRFKDAHWSDNPSFNFIKQSYLLWDRWVHGIFADLGDLDPKKAQKVRFYTRQFTNSMAPTNYLWTNPKAIKKTVQSGGMNLFQGAKNFYRDLEQGGGKLSIKMVDDRQFRLGDSIAATKGSVVFQNDLIQLIQYAPTTKNVYQIPLLIIPPCINKFYIFDLRPDYSFVRWYLDKGYSVFMVSWVNPDRDLATKTFEDYVFDGIDRAVQTVCSITKSAKINAMGFCIGGNLLSFLSAYYADSPHNPLGSTTYLATLFDFEKSGDLGVFIDENQLDVLEKRLDKKGYMDGQLLARTFNLLRANDLIWSFVINNYLLGEEPGAFDLLYWNSDSTNLPSSMFLYYLRELFLKNKLIKPGSLMIRDRPVDLGRVQIPSFILSTKDDHIAPWQSGYKGSTLMGGDTTFVLGGSGHIAGVFNHPKSQKYQYWTAPEAFTKKTSADDWLKVATVNPGSWWEEWAMWSKPLSGPYVRARTPGSVDFPCIEDAPGTFVIKK